MRRPVRGVKLVVVAAVVALMLVGVFVRSFSAAESTGRASPVLEILAFVLGVWVPLFALIYACVRSRVAVVALAFCVGLSVNLVFLTHAMPAAAVTDNSSVFTFENSTTFNAPNVNMRQNYTPSASTATTCPGTASFNWQCVWDSDTFTLGQTVSAGTAQADLYLSNNPTPLLRFASNLAGTANSVCTLNKPTGLADGDVMLAACAFRGGTGTTVDAVPSGWTLVGSRVDNSTTISLVVYSRVVTTASSEPASYTWTLSSSQKLGASIVAYSGIDNANPIDAEGGQATGSDTSHATPSITTTVSNDILVAYFATATCTNWTAPAGMTERSDTTFCSQGAGTNTDMLTTDDLLGAAGSTGAITATNDSAAVGVTKAVALRRDTAPKTCTLTAQLARPVQFRSSSSNIADGSTSMAINVPAGVVNGDVMVAVVAWRFQSGLTVSGPAGWTLLNAGGNGACCSVNEYTRVASNEPASYTWTSSASTGIAGGISAYTNVDTVTVVDVQGGNASSGLTATTPILTTTQPAEMLVATFVTSFTATWTPPAGMAERFDRTIGGTWTESISLADGIQALAGAVSKSATATANGSGATHLLALRSAAGYGALGSTTMQITSPATSQLVSASIATPAVTFATDDRLQVEVVAPVDQVNCAVSVSYDSTASPSKLTVAADVPEGVAGLLFLAPALPAVRWWKRRQS